MLIKAPWKCIAYDNCGEKAIEKAESNNVGRVHNSMISGLG